MAEMIDRLRNMVRSAGELNLLKFFQRAQSRRELVVAFLSVLELVRLAEISLVQRETFGDITARTVSPA
jgi:chromatin segregation and condensation protein Rec8/ScpA/Scc1 (kleisin family)